MSSKFKFTNSIDSLIEQYANLEITKRQFYKRIQEVGGWDAYESRYSSITKAEKFRSYKLSERNLEVVYVCGASGSGKTTFGKWIASKLNYDPFVSGSGEDFLDGYDKEECIILDDFRAGTMKFSELLKMLDNNTNSSVRSRYYNKDISNCKLIVLTTILQPAELYSFFKNEDGSLNGEPIEQFYRRIKHHFFYISPTKIYEVKTKDGSKKEYLDVNIMYDELGIKRETVDDTSIMNTLLEKVVNENKEQSNKS